MKDWSNDPSHHERTLLPRSYISIQNVLSAPLNKTFPSFLPSFLPIFYPIKALCTFCTRINWPYQNCSVMINWKGVHINQIFSPGGTVRTKFQYLCNDPSHHEKDALPWSCVLFLLFQRRKVNMVGFLNAMMWYNVCMLSRVKTVV